MELFPPTSIVILTYDEREDLVIQCLNSVLKTKYPNTEIILVAAACEPASINYVKEMFPNVKVLYHPSNLGLSIGWSIGIKSSVGEYIVLLNDDCEIDENCVSELIKVMEKDLRIGITACKAYFPNSRVIQYAGGFLDHKGNPILCGIGELDSREYDSVKDVQWAGGGIMTIRRDLVEKIGYLDAKYWVHYAETEYCFRARKAGYRVVFVPTAKVWHHGGGGKKPSRKMILLNSKNRVRLILEYFKPQDIQKWLLSEIRPSSMRYLFCTIIAIIWNIPLFLKRLFNRSLK